MFLYATIQSLDGALAAIERALVILLTAAITAIMMTQVVLRYFFSAPIFWAEEISVQLLVFATLFGLSLLVRGGDLVSIDFLPRALPDRARHALLAALGLVLLVILAFIAWLGWNWIARPEVRIELAATTQLPRWYSYTVLPVAMVTTTVHQAAAVLRHLHDLAGARS